MYLFVKGDAAKRKNNRFNPEKILRLRNNAKESHGGKGNGILCREREKNAGRRPGSQEQIEQAALGCTEREKSLSTRGGKDRCSEKS